MNATFKRHIRRLVNYWPPFLGAGIRVTRWDEDWRAIDVALPLHRWNANFVGTHYGGSLYSMVDPFYMLMLIENLGPDYVVWDKSANIRFRRPGKGRVRPVSASRSSKSTKFARHWRRRTNWSRPSPSR